MLGLEQANSDSPCSEVFLDIINRPGVAGAVLQTPSSFIN